MEFMRWRQIAKDLLCILPLRPVELSFTSTGAPIEGHANPDNSRVVTDQSVSSSTFVISATYLTVPSVADVLKPSPTPNKFCFLDSC